MAPTHGQLWTNWFNAYREALPSDHSIGWYDITDLKAAFDAGARADYVRNMEIIFDKIRQGANEAAPPDRSQP